MHVQAGLGYKFRKRSNAVVGVAVEAYLRDDILCGSSECLLCALKTPRLAPHASHYVVPDAGALQELLDVFELPAFSSFILLTSVLRKVSLRSTAPPLIAWGSACSWQSSTSFAGSLVL